MKLLLIPVLLGLCRVSHQHPHRVTDWKDNTVHYIISPDNGNRKIVDHVIKGFEQHTCLKFKPRANEGQYITFKVEEKICWPNYYANEVCCQDMIDCVYSVVELVSDHKGSLDGVQAEIKRDRDTFKYPSPYENMLKGIKVDHDYILKTITVHPGKKFIQSDPENEVMKLFFEFFKFANKYQKCQDKQKCAGKNLNCQNGGFQTTVGDLCVCDCPYGLDPATSCLTNVTDLPMTPAPDSDIREFIFIPRRIQFSVAESLCGKWNAKFATFRNKLDEDIDYFIAKKLGKNHWLGLTDIREEGSHEWADQSTPSFNITMWKASEPDVMYYTRDCVITDSFSRGWESQYCEYSEYVLCQFNKRRTYPCQGKNLNCQNGGYQTTENDMCVCRCPYGQDPDTACSKYKDSEIEGNKKNYLLLKAGFTYLDAKDECKQYRGSVATAKNMEEIKNLLDVRGITKSIWLGLTDYGQEGQFQWGDGTKLDWANWAKGQPNNLDNQDCVIMDEHGKWKDVKCNRPIELHSVICEIPNEEVENYSAKKEYVYIQTLLNYHDAEKECAKYNGHLAVPQNKRQNDRLAILRKGTSVAWIGLSDRVIEGDYITSSGAAFNGWTHWNEGEPSGRQLAIEDCVTMLPSGKWNDIACSHKYYSFCEIPIPDCKVGFLEKPCYLPLKQPMNYNDAMTACKNVFGCIAVPKTQEQNDALASLSKKDSWIGIKDSRKKGAFTNCQNDPPRWYNWYMGETENQDCAVMTGGLNKWRETSCSSKYHTVCQKNRVHLHLDHSNTYTFIDKDMEYYDAKRVCEDLHGHIASDIAIVDYFRKNNYITWLEDCNVLSAGITKMHVSCDEKHFTVCATPVPECPSRSKYCFLSLDKPSKTYDQAEEECYKRNGSLPIIRSKKDNVKLGQMRPDKPMKRRLTWLGLTDRAYENEWKWNDGTHASFTVWRWKEPNNEKNEDCAIMHRNRQWNDVDCNFHHEDVYTTCVFSKTASRRPCYVFFNQKLTKKKAKEKCAKVDGHLATPKSKNLNTIVSSDRKSNDYSIWLGLSIDQTEQKYLWEDDGSKMQWTNWNRELSYNGDCVYMDSFGEWVDVPCNDRNQTHYTLCEIPGFDAPNQSTKCYKFIDKRLSYSLAEVECAKFNSQLATPKSLNDNYDVSDARKTVYYSIWLGATKIENKQLVWSDGSGNVSWTNWVDGKPTADQGCVIMEPFYTWKNVNCYCKEYYSVCEKRLSSISVDE